MRFLFWQQASLQRTVLSFDVWTPKTALHLQMHNTVVVLEISQASHYYTVRTSQWQTFRLRIWEVPGWSPRRRRPSSRTFMFFIRVARIVPGRYIKLAKIAPWYARSNYYTLTDLPIEAIQHQVIRSWFPPPFGAATQGGSWPPHSWGF